MDRAIKDNKELLQRIDALLERSSSQEELKALEEERDKKRKARKNNGTRRDMHYEMEAEEHDVFPDDPEFDIGKAREFSKEPRICIRYECIPIRFIEHVYK